MKRASNVDTIVGHNIRIQRMARRLSQSELGEKIGVSFQQMQKYDKGVNRISAGRLWHLAHALGIPIDTFYASTELPAGKQPSPLRLISNPDSLRLAQSFARIKSRALRRALVSLVKRLAERT